MQASHGELRPLGVVYTPPEVTEPMTRVALEPLIRGRSVADLLALRVCDPAIGEGAFLLAAVRVLGEHLVRGGLAPAEARARAAGCVFGVDVDPRAVAAAQAALGTAPGQLQVADALALDWTGAFPDAFARGGFDAVIGNPPYVRQEHLGAHKPLLRRFASYDGVADLYVYFLELVHRLARAGGRYCLITPNKWLTAAYARKLRGYLAAQHSVEGVVDLARSALFGAADAFPCIVWGTVGAACDAPIRAARLPAGTASELATHLATGVATDLPHVPADLPTDDPPAEARDEAPSAPPDRGLHLGVPHARQRWRADPWHIDAPADRALIDRLEARWPPLGEVVPGRPARGVVTGYNRAFVLDRDARDRLLADEPAAASVIRPFVKGRDVRCWLPAEPERWILLIGHGTSLDELPAVMAHLARFRAALEPRPPGSSAGTPGRKPGSYRWYELQDPVGPLVRTPAPRLLYQDIQSAPVACLDRGGELVPDTTVWMLPSGDLYLLAVLSSPLYGWYARRRFPPALNGSVRPKLEYLRNLPIATPRPDQRAWIEQLVGQRLELEPARRAGAEDAVTAAPALDPAIAAAVHDVYELSAAERALIAPA